MPGCKADMKAASILATRAHITENISYSSQKEKCFCPTYCRKHDEVGASMTQSGSLFRRTREEKNGIGS
jgi:hypothetical protein